MLQAREVVALRLPEVAGRFDADGRDGRGMPGIVRAAWLRREALLLRGQSDSKGDDSVRAERPRDDVTNSGPLPRIEGYELQRQIGRGASATVYLAREKKHDRLVALKVLHPVLAASLQAERFLREISIVARLSHPNILPLLDSGTAGELLYYSTPYVPGESLRNRLERDGKLPVAEAVRLVREAADALDYAHRMDLVHRDVKPENILLADGHALLADFGIARAMRVALGEQLTAVGVAPGTLHYMSPEQASPDGTVDGRSDQYSLACVLYELLSGAPPFTGATLEEIAVKHAVGKIPPFKPATVAVPAHIKVAIHRALAKSKDDRFATAAEFSAALTATSPGWVLLTPRMWIPRRRVILGLLVLTAVVGLATVVERVRATPNALRLTRRTLVALGISDIRLDTTAYLTVANGDADTALIQAVAGGMRNALDRWRDVNTADDPESGNRSPRRTGVDFARAARRDAYRLEAGRFVLLTVSAVGDSARVSASLRDTRTGQALATAETHLAKNAGDVSAQLLRLSDELLFRIGPLARATGNPGTTSLAARQLYLAGHAAMANGDFAGADSAFTSATTVDPEYPQALIWLANLRSWLREPSPWQELAPRALSRRSMLETDDNLLLDGLLALGAGDLGVACAKWTSLTTTAPNDFASWYGLGNCLRKDSAVVRDSRARTGWRFRSSRHQAIRAYERAFRLRPNVMLGFGGRSLTELRRIMLTLGSFVQPGRAVPPDTQSFSGYRVWEGDSLALLPLTGTQIPAGPGSFAMDEAVQQQRLRFRELSLLWKATFPRSADAIEAVAIALEMLGDESAPDTLKRARALATDDDDRLRMAVSEALMHVKFFTPRNPARVTRGRELIDSILAANPPESTVAGELLSALAALTGRATLAASYARLSAIEGAPPALARSGPALIAFASLGGPRDSVAALEAVVDRAVRSLPESQRAAARRDWLTRAAVLAFPTVRLTTLPDTGNTGLRLGNVVARVLASDTAAVIARLTEIARARRWVRPADITTDGVHPEAAALVAVGAADTAIARLDPTLNSLQFTAIADLSNAYRTGPLVRAMALRAELAAAAGDAATARLWATAVLTLWSNADPFLDPVVRAMRRLSPQ